MKKVFVALACIGVACALGVAAHAGGYKNKKIVYLNSYHRGYHWSDGELSGARDELAHTGVEFRVFYMDTKRNPSHAYGKFIGMKTKRFIEKFRPDVIIAADDNAFEYVIKPYYRDAAVPVVFCGINWDVSIYKAPYRNTTGVIEIGLVGQTYKLLRPYAKGNKVGIIGFDTDSERKNAQYYPRQIDARCVRMDFVKDFESWKRSFLEVQKQVDIVIVADPSGIKNWDEKKAEEFVLANVRIPVGTETQAMMPVCLLGLTKIPQEQGRYAAAMALKIIDGVKPADMPIVANKKGDLHLNLKMAEKLNIIFTPSMLRSAKVIIDKEG
ncbi:MAG: ABC transporter substrate binding protein [Candidatus Omnitrophota bacterium]